MFLETRAARIAYVAGLTLVLSSLGFWAAVELGSSGSSVAQAAVTDAPFAKNAAFGEMQDLKFSQLAAHNAGSDAVRDFAAEVVADHTQAADDLNRAAFKENISLPTEMATRDQATYERLSQLNGAAFDRAYVQEIVRDLQADLQVYRHEVVSGNDAMIRNFASRTVPFLEKHLEAAHRLAKQVSPSNKRVDGNGLPLGRGRR